MVNNNGRAKVEMYIIRKSNLIGKSGKHLPGVIPNSAAEKMQPFHSHARP